MGRNFLPRPFGGFGGPVKSIEHKNEAGPGRFLVFRDILQKWKMALNNSDNDNDYVKDVNVNDDRNDDVINNKE